ncbi:ribose ABC transporter permease [Bacillaceae bacterium Marseille-Q3522]|nr:ribose ABC transporter permease [Bacillaceae bacterium Marseille-Q3522]
MNPQMKTNVTWSHVRSEYSVFIALVVLIILSSIAHPDFLSVINLSNILRQVSIIGIISVGMTFIIISGGIDLSVGSVLALTGTITIMLLNATENAGLAVITALLFGLFVGFINGILVTKGRINPFIVTLGTMAAARSLSLYFANGGSVSGTDTVYSQIANGYLFGMAYPIYLFIFVVVFAYMILHKTRFGRYVYAIGSNEKAALLSAIRTERVKIGVYMIGGLLVGLGAVIESSRLNSISSASSGYSYELDAIAAVIIGGTRMSGGKGKILGTVAGILILGIINNMMNLMNVSPYLQGLVKGAIIILAVLLQKKNA